MDQRHSLQQALALIDRIRPIHYNNVIDLERVRLQRKMAQMQRDMTRDEWRDFVRSLVAELALRKRPEYLADGYAADEADCEGGWE